MRKIEVVPDFARIQHCTVTSTWTNNEDNREFHTWQAWGSRDRKTQLDYVMGPKDIRSTTWNLSRVRFRTWDHFPVITKIDGCELKTKRRVQGWAGWATVSEAEKAKFQKLVLRPRSGHDEVDQREPEDSKGLVLLHDRLVDAVAEIKATTTFSRNRNKFCVPDEIRQMASDAAKCRDPARRRHLRKIAQEARRQFEAGKAVVPRGKVINRPVVTKFWVNGRASEDRDEWTGEVWAHCERCYDTEETPEVQAERIRRQRISGDRRVALQERRVTITMDKVLRPRGEMLRNKANRPAHCLVTEMLQCLPTETVCEVAHWSDKRFKGECRAPEAWKVLRLVFRKKPDAKLEKGPSWVPYDRTVEFVLQVVHDRLVGHATR